LFSAFTNVVVGKYRWTAAASRSYGFDPTGPAEIGGKSDETRGKTGVKCDFPEGRSKRPKSDSNRRITDLQSVPADSQDTAQPALTPSADFRLSPDLSPAIEKHPELVQLIRTWSTLPDAMRAGILAMVGATQLHR